MPSGGYRPGAGRKPNPPKPPPRGVGRPAVKQTYTPVDEKEIDFNQVEQLAAIHCTQEEIGHFFNLSRPTIERLAREEKFREYYDRGLAKGRMSIRRAQVKMLENGNATMGIWLGKQILGQRDLPAAEPTTEAVQQKPALPEWLQQSIKNQQPTSEASGSTSHSPHSSDSTATSPIDSKGSVVQ